MTYARTTPTSDQSQESDIPGGRCSYSISQAAALLGVSRVSIWRWIRDGRLPASRLGHRTIRIMRDDLDRFLVPIGPAAARSGVVLPNPDAGSEAMMPVDSRSAPPADWSGTSDTEHFVQFYESDAFLLSAVGGFIGAALHAGDTGIVVATEAHRRGLDEQLATSGLDMAAVRAAGRYVALDAAETLSRFMVDGEPGPVRFVEVIGGIIAHAATGGRRVRVFGEMVALLALDGNQAAALRLEKLWNGLRRTHAFSLFCAYPIDRLGGEALAGALGDVCAEHTSVIPAESYAALPTAPDRLRAVTLLQQKAAWLEDEIAERRQAEERLREALAAERAAREATEAALRLRDEFLSIAAHELRTPITSLSGYAQLVLRRLRREGQVEPEQVRHALQAINGEVKRLSGLLSRLLDVSRLEAGKLSLERQGTDLAALVEHAVASARTWSDRHTITLSAPPTLEAQIDPLRLEQVLTNLLDNAIRYSPDGGLIEVMLNEPEPGVAALSVRDHGIGIPPEKRDQIFERFYQAHTDGHRHGIAGLGLGLYISRQIVDLHDGDISVDFPAGGGARFTVRLPLDQERPATVIAGPWVQSDSAVAESVALQVGAE